MVALVGIKMRIERFRAKGKFSKVQLQAGLHYSVQSVFDIRCLGVALERVSDALTFFCGGIKILHRCGFQTTIKAILRKV